MIVDKDQVELTATGVSALVNILRGDRHDNAVILAGEIILTVFIIFCHPLLLESCLELYIILSPAPDDILCFPDAGNC